MLPYLNRTARFSDDEVIAAARITPAMLESATRVERRELERREHAYRNGRVAVPVVAPETCRDLAQMADDVICVEVPVPFSAVGLWYQDFSQTTDDEVRALLDAAARAPAGQGDDCRG